MLAKQTNVLVITIRMEILHGLVTTALCVHVPKEQLGQVYQSKLMMGIQKLNVQIRVCVTETRENVNALRITVVWLVRELFVQMNALGEEFVSHRRL